jgi:drug/metabolite transporter (DMT)-like permease
MVNLLKIGFGSIFLLIINFFLHLIFNHYKILNESLGSLILSLITLVSIILFFYYLSKILKKKNNPRINIYIILIYGLLATLILLFNYITTQIKFY